MEFMHIDEVKVGQGTELMQIMFLFWPVPVLSLNQQYLSTKYKRNDKK